MRHLFVTQNFPPDMGGMERMNVELARRFAKAPDTLVVSTVAAGPAAAPFDAGEAYEIHRQPFTWKRAKTTVNWMRWGTWLSGRAREGFDILHVGNIRPAGYAGWWTAKRRGLPYVLYVVGHDLIKDVRKARTNALRKTLTRSILGDAAGVVAISNWVAELAKESMREVGVKKLPPVATVDLGTDPSHFSPARDTGALRKRYGLEGKSLLVTVSRLYATKGQDTAIRALALLKDDFPDLSYLVVGDGESRLRLEGLAKDLGVAERVVFAGRLSDAEIAEAYATATVYVGPTRNEGWHVEGFGISFVEAAASGVPSVAGDSGGVRAAVREGETGFVVPPEAHPVADAVALLLRDPARRAEMGRNGRRAVETHWNWDRAAREARAFAVSVVEKGRVSR